MFECSNKNILKNQPHTKTSIKFAVKFYKNKKVLYLFFFFSKYKPASLICVLFFTAQHFYKQNKFTNTIK